MNKKAWIMMTFLGSFWDEIWSRLGDLDDIVLDEMVVIFSPSEWEKMSSQDKFDEVNKVAKEELKKYNFKVSTDMIVFEAFWDNIIKDILKGIG